MSSLGRSGWHVRYEPAPSLCRHHVPIYGAHALSVSCFCKPFIQNELEYTIVMHEDRNVRGWKVEPEMGPILSWIQRLLGMVR